MWQFENAQSTWNDVFRSGDGYGRGDGNNPWGSGYGGYQINDRYN